MITTGEDFADALSAGVAAAVADAAVLLTPSEVRHATVEGYLTDTTTAYAVGGPAARPYGEATALVGADRTETATMVAEAFFDAPTTVGIARADVFADALSGGPHIARAGGPMLLTAPTTASVATTSYLTGLAGSLTDLVVYGGETAITTAVVDALITAATG